METLWVCDEGGGSPGRAGTTSLCVGAAPSLEGTGRHLGSQLALGAGGWAELCPHPLRAPGDTEAGLAAYAGGRGGSPGVCVAGRGSGGGLLGSGDSSGENLPWPAPDSGPVPLRHHKAPGNKKWELYSFSAGPIPQSPPLGSPRGQRSPGLGTRGPKASQKLLLVLQVLAHLLAHVEDGAVPAAGGRGRGQGQGWLPGLHLRPAPRTLTLARCPAPLPGWLLFAQWACGEPITVGTR